jgi:hypothetical protein
VTSICVKSLSDLDLATVKEMAAKRKTTPTKMLKLPPMKEYAFSVDKIPLVQLGCLLIKEMNPRAENPSARMTRLKLVANARN